MSLRLPPQAEPLPPWGKLAQNRLFATDFVTEVESGQKCFDKVAASGLGMGNPLAGLSVVPFCGRTVREAGPYSFTATEMCHPERSEAKSKDLRTIDTAKIPPRGYALVGMTLLLTNR